MSLIERRENIPEGKPTDLGWMLSCSGVHPEAVKIVEGLQGEVERLQAWLFYLDEATEDDNLRAAIALALKGEAPDPIGRQ